ncbi:hypothetical protein GSI_02937 [Ganoderma sinense ZZ0214-1]|uniref:F-box domain-containing protein n=1 Tax=Ganoderma sinense ZZ0214-1 TaxID=1077348 RepID=A0A2G8SNJ7_9APHY|nr:hypothetical protein GSI_02937 [Ganoderma sinense ZZ0214-1]
MATSTALTNSDILSLIFECFILRPLEDVAYSEETRAALARVARVCVAFHEPAVRLLWKDLTSFVALLRCLPSSLTRVKAKERNLMSWNIYMLNGNVVPQEWERMRLRAEYVKRLDLRASEDRLGLATWAYLSHLTQDHPLLPNLRRLGCTFDSPQSTLMTRPLLSPNLTHLYIDCALPGGGGSEWECSLRSFFHVICSIATRLSHIDIYASRSYQIPFPFTVLSPIRQLHFLRSVVLDWSTSSLAIDLPPLQSVLSDMKSLEVLELTGREGFMTSNHWDARPQLEMSLAPRWTLKNLRELEVNFFYPLTMNDELYSCIDSPHLRELRDFSHVTTQERSVTRVSIIAHHFPHLQVLFLTSFSFFAPSDFSLGLIVPSLSTLHAITTFKLFLSSEFEAQGITRDGHIHALAKAWPLLTTLSVYTSFPSSSSLSPAALVSLATLCPKLEVLDLPSLRILESGLSCLDDYPVLDHTLAIISFRRLELTDCKYAASLLDRLFPHLCIRGSPSPSFPYIAWRNKSPPPLYEQVEAQLKAVQAARRQHGRRVHEEDVDHIYPVLNLVA